MFFINFQQLYILLCSLCRNILKRSGLNIHAVSFQNGFKRFYPVNILVLCEHNFYFFRDRFKHVGDSQYLEIVATSKEIMSFHDHGVVVFRFGLSSNELSRNIALPYFLVKRGL